jgi:hypothetical protein
MSTSRPTALDKHEVQMRTTLQQSQATNFQRRTFMKRAPHLEQIHSIKGEFFSVLISSCPRSYQRFSHSWRIMTSSVKNAQRLYVKTLVDMTSRATKTMAGSGSMIWALPNVVPSSRCVDFTSDRVERRCVSTRLDVFVDDRLDGTTLGNVRETSTIKIV